MKFLHLFLFLYWFSLAVGYIFFEFNPDNIQIGLALACTSLFFFGLFIEEI